MGYTLSIPVESRSKVLTFLEKEFKKASDIFPKLGLYPAKYGWYDGMYSYAPKRKDLVALDLNILSEEEGAYLRALAHWIAMRFGKMEDFGAGPMHLCYYDTDALPMAIASEIDSDRFEYEDGWMWALPDDGIPLWNPVQQMTPVGKKPSILLRIWYNKRRVGKVNDIIRAELARLNKAWYEFK